MSAWISVKDRLPEIPEGEKCSKPVLAGMWYEDNYRGKDHPRRKKFMMGICTMILQKNSKHYPEGKSWQTFGPSHNDITHWMPTPEPPQDDINPLLLCSVEITKSSVVKDGKHTYWCKKCKSWTMFQFEDWDMCDDCAIGEAFSDENMVDLPDDPFSQEELELLRTPISKE
jgi:hypothetical protein